MPPSTRRWERKTKSALTPSAVPELSKPFSFLDLPDTVRQRFYEIQLEAERGYVRTFCKAAPFRCRVTPAKVKLNIMFTCRQVYQEALPVLYRVNSFCMVPLHSDPEAASETNQTVSPDAEQNQHALPQNDRWIRGMPLKGRNLIQKLELRLPVPSCDREDHSYRNMHETFPGLKSMTLFFDFTGPYRGWWNVPDPDELNAFYQQLKKDMPQPRQIYLDARLLENNSPEWQPLINAVTQIWNASPGISAYITQDLHHQSKYDKQKQVLDLSLTKALGARAPQFEALHYWRLRENQAANEDLYLTDDDTDDEIKFFDEFDVDKIVERTKSDMEAVDQARFDLIAERDDFSYW